MSKKKKTNRNIRGKVLNIFKENPTKLFNYKQIASKLNIKDTQKRNSVIKAMGQLNAQKMIDQKSPGKYVFVVDNKDFIEGIIDMTASGNAYLQVFEKEGDIFIARRNTNRSLDGDRVLVYQIKKRNNGKREGKVVEVLERAKQDYVGILEIKKDLSLIHI